MFGFDIDSVMVDTYPYARKYFLIKYGIDFKPKEHTTFNFDLPDGADPMKDFEELCGDTIMKPLGNSFDVVRKVYEITGQLIYFVTARNPSTKLNTINNIRKYIDPRIKYEVYFTDGKQKTKVLKNLGITYFVDDRFKTCNELAGKIDHVFCLNQPWNMGRTLDRRVIRLNKIDDLLKYLR